MKALGMTDLYASPSIRKWITTGELTPCQHDPQAKACMICEGTGFTPSPSKQTEVNDTIAWEAKNGPAPF